MVKTTFNAQVMRVYVDETAKILIRLRSDQLPKDQWHTIAPGTPGANTFLAIALTSMTSGLPCEAGLDENEYEEYSALRRLEIVRA